MTLKWKPVWDIYNKFPKRVGYNQLFLVFNGQGCFNFSFNSLRNLLDPVRFHNDLTS